MCVRKAVTEEEAVTEGKAVTEEEACIHMQPANTDTNVLCAPDLW